MLLIGPAKVAKMFSDLYISHSDLYKIHSWHVFILSTGLVAGLVGFYEVFSGRYY